MRALFTAYDGYGHIVPLMGLARALVQDGHEVLVATSPSLRPVAGDAGIASVPAGLSNADAMAEARRRWPRLAAGPPAAWTMRMFCEIAAPAMASDLRPIIEDWRPDIVVREEGEHGGALAAARSGVPWVTHGWGSPLPPAETLARTSRLLGPVWEAAGMRVPQGNALYGAGVLDPCPPSLYPVPLGVANRWVIRPASSEEPPARAPQDGRIGAYVGFGTVPLFSDAPGLLHAVVTALVDLDFDVTVTTGDDRLAGTLRSIDPRRVRVERWVDLWALLSSCGVVVCHGGAGTVLAALAAGVPLLLVPRGAPSQIRMTEACEARGVGLGVTWTGRNDHDLRTTLSGVVQSESMASAATAVAREIEAMPPASTAISLLQDIGDKSRRPPA